MTSPRSVAAALARRGRVAVASRRTPPPLADDGRTRVLVTGAAGLIGGIVRPALSGEFQVRGLDLRAGPGVDWVRDMRRLESIAPAFSGIDVVLDLAAVSSLSASWHEVRRNNVPATINAFEAARQAGVRRVVFASSNHAVGMYEREEPWASVVGGVYEGLDPATLPRLGVDVSVRPDGPYGVGKAFGEAVGRYYADAFEISVICLRIGTVNRVNRPTTLRHFATLLTHRDLLALVRSCIKAPADVRFGVVYGVSRNTWRLWDLESARDLVGFEPGDDVETFRAGFAAAT
jgi:uronate dehydrogenase